MIVLYHPSDSCEMPITPRHNRRIEHVELWIQELANALSLELDDFGKELLVESK